MSKFTIYDKSGNVLHESITEYSGDGKVVYTDSLEYNGSWMGECFITVSVKSPYPINFQIGDYIDYRGERFTLNNDPSVSKKARRGTYGEAFVYENIKFEARQSELTEIRFLDYVLYDNELHYTSLPDFPFYAADIDDYCDRLQANTNRWCESNNFAQADYWVFLTPTTNENGYPLRTVQRLVASGFTSGQACAMWQEAYGEGTYTEDEKKDVSVDISKESIWDSMQRIKNDFGLNFISRGRSVIVGSAGVPTNRIFKYGKGEGLYELERQADTEQAVVTKLFTYGSDKNMPVRYYGNISYSYYATVARIYANYATSGLHYADFLIDIDFKSTLFTTRSQSYPGTADNPNYIVEVQVDDITVRGYVSKDYASDRCRVYCEYTGGDDDRDEPDEEKMDAFSEAIDTGSKVYFVAGIDTKKWPADKRENTASDLPNNMAVSHLMLPGFPTTSLYAWVIANGGTAVEDTRNCDDYGRATWEFDDVEYDAFFSKNQYNPYILSVNFKDIGIREASKVFDGSDDTEEIYPTIDGTGYDVIQGAEVIEDNGVFEDGETEPTITLTLPNFGVGFDLKELASNGQNPTIFMKDGYCGSREFTFESGNVRKNQDGTYTIKAKREHDTLLDLWFPYSYGVSCGGQAVADEPYQVRAGDHYVLTGIEMTSTYIEANAVKLLGYSLKFLSKNDYTRYTYLPKVDEIEMARQHDDALASQGSVRSLYLTLKEGDIMLFEDADLGIEGDVFIDSLHIKENGNNGIPTYEVTLRDDKQVGAIQKIQNKIDSLSSSVASGGNNISNQYLKNAINAYGSEIFLRKDEPDTAQGTIGFLQGLWVKAKGLFGIDADGNGKFNNVGVKGWVNALTGIFNTLKSGNFTQGDLTGTGFQLTNDDGTGASQLVVDNIVARMKFIANVLEVRKYVSMGGNYVFSPAASVIEQVDYYDSNGTLLGYQQITMPWLLRAIPLLAQTKIFSTKRWIRNVGNVNMNTVAKFRCWIKADDGTTKTVNTWQVGMLARCQTMDLQQSEGGTHTDSNISGANKNRLYWREVVGTGSGRLTLDDGYDHNYIDLSNEPNHKLLNSDNPIVGDSVVCFGATTVALSNIIVIETVGSDAPAFKEYLGVGLQHIGQDNASGEFPNFSLEDANHKSTLMTRISPKSGNRFIAPEFIIQTGGTSVSMNAYMGIFVPGTSVAYANQEWSYAGSTWVCLVDNTTAIPSESSQAWEMKVSKGSAPNVNMLLRTIFEKGLDVIKEKWAATNWNWVSMDSSQDTQYIEGHQSLRFVIPAGSSNEMMFYQSVLGILKPNTWYTFSFNLFASKSVTFCIHNIEGSTYKNVYTDGKVIVDGVERTGVTNTHNDVEIQVPTGGTLWDGKRHYITFKTNSNIVTGVNDTLKIGWYFSNQSADAAQNFVLCMPKLEEGEVMTPYTANDEDYIGADGEDSFAFRTIPESVIVTEKRANSGVSYDYPTRIQVKANIGGTDSNVTISSVTSDCLTVAKVTESGEDKISISGVATDYRYDPQHEHTYASATQGTIGVTGTCNGKSFSLSISVYFNRLGSMAIVVQADSVKEVATKTGFYDTEHGVDQLQLMGQYVRSSEENVSILSKSVSGLDNLLLGTELFTADNKLLHESADADGVVEYTGANDTPHIYTPISLTAGEKYTIQCKTDGTLASAHDGSGGTQIGKFTIWLRYTNPNDPTDYENFCFTSQDYDMHSEDLGNGVHRYWWTFQPTKSVTFWLRTNTYSDGTTVVSVNFWDIMLQSGSIASGWVAPSRGTMSQIKQTAEEIDLSITNRLGETGININGNNRTIHLTAEHTTIDGDLTVPKVTTVKETGFKIEIDGSKFNVYNGQDKVGLSIGWDEYNNPFLFLSNADGSKSVKLTYDGIITDSGNFSSDSFAPVQYKKLEDNHSVTPTQANEGVYDGGNNPSSAGYSDYYVYTAGRNLVTGVYQNSDGKAEQRAECDGKTFSSNNASTVLTNKPYIAEGYYIGCMYSITKLNDNIHRKEVISFVSSSPFQGSPSIAGYIYIIKVTPISGSVQYYFCDKNGNNQVTTFDTNHIYNS